LQRIYQITDIADLMEEIASRDLGNNRYATRLLGRLHKAIHDAGAIYFYEEDGESVERVLDIFIRVNSGGTVLSYSDLLLSIATAQWSQRDARKEIQDLLDRLNATGAGFRFPKDTILKAGLVLTGVTDFAFKVRNFNTQNMAELQKQWDDIAECLTVAVNLLADFGLSDATLSANSVLIPVAYYVSVRHLSDAYRTAPSQATDREALRSWVLRSLIKQGVWGSGLDTLLRDLRDEIKEHGSAGFPAAQIEARIAARGKWLTFNDAEIDELCNLAYGAKRTFGVLALLFPHVDTRNHHHVDHVYPRSLLTPAALKRGGLDSEQTATAIRRRDLLPNLQLLEGPVNISKSDKAPAAWANSQYPEPRALDNYLDRNDLGTLPADAAGFEVFFDVRRAILRRRLVELLGVTAASVDVEQLDQPATSSDLL
jgi:hypothetical protein